MPGSLQEGDFLLLLSGSVQCQVVLMDDCHLLLPLGGHLCTQQVDVGLHAMVLALGFLALLQIPTCLCNCWHEDLLTQRSTDGK